MMLIGSEVKRPVPTLCVTHHRSLPLRKQSVKRHVAGCENTQVAVHRQNVLIFFQCFGDTYRNGLLTNTTKPFADLILSQQNEHLLLNHPGLENSLKELF